MHTLIFSQTAIFQLQQLGSQHYRTTGTRYKLATQEGVLSLLRDVSNTPDHSVRHCFEDFVAELNNRQINTLTSLGINLKQPSQNLLTERTSQAS